MENSESKLQFGLDARYSYDMQVPGRPRRVVEKRGLSDPGFTVNNENAATPGTGGVHQLVEHSLLASPIDEPRSEAHRHPPICHWDHQSHTDNRKSASPRPWAIPGGDGLAVAIAGVGHMAPDSRPGACVALPSATSAGS